MQLIQYASRAIQLAQELFDDEIESRFLEMLEGAKSNIRQHQDGRRIYERFVKPAMVDWEKVRAHYAVSSVFEGYPEQAKIYCYTFERHDYQAFGAGEAKLVVARATATSHITRESAKLTFGVLHFGGHIINGGIRLFRGEEAFEALVAELYQAFARADFAEVIRVLDRQFGKSTYSLRSLFRDEQRKASAAILESALAEAEAAYRQV